MKNIAEQKQSPNPPKKTLRKIKKMNGIYWPKKNAT